MYPRLGKNKMSEINSLDDFLKENSEFINTPYSTTFINLIIFNPNNNKEILFLIKSGIRAQGDKRGINGKQLFCLPGDEVAADDQNHICTIKRILKSLGVEEPEISDKIQPFTSFSFVDENREKVNLLYFVVKGVDRIFKNTGEDRFITHIGYKEPYDVKRLVIKTDDMYAIQYNILSTLEQLPQFKDKETNVLQAYTDISPKYKTEKLPTTNNKEENIPTTLTIKDSLDIPEENIENKKDKTKSSLLTTNETLAAQKK
jgi:hypothetical protein